MKTEDSARFKCSIYVSNFCTFANLYALMFIFFGIFFGYAMRTRRTIITDNDLPVLTLVFVFACMYFSGIDEFYYREIVKEFGHNREPTNETVEVDGNATVNGHGRQASMKFPVYGATAEKKSKTE